MPVNILNTAFNLIAYQSVLEQICDWKSGEGTRLITITNPHSVLLCERNELMRLAHQKADMTLPDGVGIILGATILGYKHHGRVTGPNLLLKLCDWGREQKLRYFFYGGATGVAESLAKNLADKYPGLEVVGTHCPSFQSIGETEEESIINMINEAKPDIVWIGLGAPKQEVWMMNHQNKIKATAMIGVGAAFDFHSFKVKWAPAWVRKLGFEWLWRLTLEPKRMWRRNFDSPIFLAKILCQKYRMMREKKVDGAL